MAPELRVLTQNLYIGADLSPILRATGPEEVLAALEEGIRQLEESDPRGRVSAVARLIAAAAPDVVSLQEAAIWRNGDRAIADYAAILVDELAGRYRLAGRRSGPPTSVPSTAGGGRSLEIGEAVLVRSGLPVIASSGDLEARLCLDTVLLGELCFSRGWVAVDGEMEGRAFRVVATHLERAEPEVPAAYGVQVAQAAELATGPGAAAAVVLAGDFNSDAHGSGPTATASYGNLVRAGFTDCWDALRPGDRGLTWRLGDEIVREDAELAERLDLVLVRGALRPLAIDVLGAEPAARTPSGRWPSDHLGVVATIGLD